MDMLAYTLVESYYLETLAKTFIIPNRQKQYNQEKSFNDAPVSQNSIARNKNTASTVHWIVNQKQFLVSTVQFHTN